MKYFSLLVVAVLLLSSNVFALTYDPETNTYIDDTPAQTQTTTTTSDTSDSDDTDDEQSQTSSVETPEDETPQTTTTATTTSSQSRGYFGPLASLHQLLDTYNDQLQTQIGDTYQTLQETVATSSDTVALQARLDILQCVGIIDDEFKIIEDIKTTQKQLRTKVRVVVADTHSEIEALETKIEEDLLDQFEENLEIAVIQNKVESLLSEYTNVINTYFDLSQDEIDQLEDEIGSNNEAYEAVLANYDRRVELLEDLEDAYDEFTRKSSFVGVVVGPSLGEVLASVDEVKRYYRIQFMAEWADEIGTRVSSDTTTYQNQARTRFNRAFSEYIDDLINTLYPLEDLQRINQEMLTIRAAYLQDNGELDCRGLATNPVIDQSAITLQTQMTDLLSQINEGANQVITDDGKLPKNTAELQAQLLEYAQGFATDEQNVLLRDEQVRVQAAAGADRSTTKRRTSESRWATTVRTFLLGQYESALANDRLDRFESKLQTALTRIDTALPNATGTAERMIRVIQAVIREFV